MEIKEEKNQSATEEQKNNDLLEVISKKDEGNIEEDEDQFSDPYMFSFSKQKNKRVAINPLSKEENGTSLKSMKMNEPKDFK